MMVPDLSILNFNPLKKIKSKQIKIKKNESTEHHHVYNKKFSNSSFIPPPMTLKLNKKKIF